MISLCSSTVDVVISYFLIKYCHPLGFKNRQIPYPKCISTESDLFYACHIFILTVCVLAKLNNALSQGR